MKGVNLAIRKGEFVSIIGKYGSGKTSLFNALLGEMRDGGGSSVALNGRVAYVSQKPWIVSDTVRGNILFGAPFDAERYAKAVHFACLKADLESLSAGEHTLIGERGCTLSGGQKARVSLARALYAEADVLLLDDVLSAVDAHVGAFLFFETLAKHLRAKTILLITHSLSFVQHTDRIVVMDQMRIVAEGNFEQLKQHPILQQVTAAKKTEKKAKKTDVASVENEIEQFEIEGKG